MCAICGIAAHVVESPAQIAAPVDRTRFAAFRNRSCRNYIVGASMSMGGDSIEHVISYWVMFQQFQSPALAGFAVISHWVPAEQLMLHDLAGRETLPNAVRLNSTGRSTGFLAGPALGSVMLLALGPALGIVANVLMYLPMTVWLARTPYTGYSARAVAAARVIVGAQRFA
jgi:hypothetical protein